MISASKNFFETLISLKDIQQLEFCDLNLGDKHVESKPAMACNDLL